jgi:hypothetical protein
VGDVEVALARSAVEWEYRRTGLEVPAGIGADGAEPAIEVALQRGAEPLLAYLDPPEVLLPGEARAIWLALPLEVRVARRGSVVDTFRPGQRWSLLGSVEHGTVLPAVVCAVVTGPDHPAIGLATGRAALKLQVQNHSGEAVTLRRVPFDPSDTNLYRSGERVLVEQVLVEIGPGKRAGARSIHGTPPAGYTLVEAPEEARKGLRLDWLLEATRRSTEYSL